MKHDSISNTVYVRNDNGDSSFIYLQWQRSGQEVSNMNVWKYDNKRFASQLRGMRTKLGKSQLEFGTSLGFPQSTISLYELGKRSPDVNSLIKIAKALGVEEIRIEVK